MSGFECSAALETSSNNRCWCRHLSQLCLEHQACYSGTDECIYLCPDFPKYFNPRCLCNEAVICEENQYCSSEGICVDNPSACQDINYADPALGCTCGSGDHGHICQTGQMCITIDDTPQCKDVNPNCPPETTIITDEYCFCNVTNSYCKEGSVCSTSESRCIDQCPEYPDPNENGESCHCSTTSTVCQTQELCGTGGCGPVCQAMPEKSDEPGCYCGESKCNAGDMCDSEEEKCWSDVNNCPTAHTTITVPVCYCTNSESLCPENKICNDRTNECSDPYPTCPSYPGVTDSTCVCNENLFCEDGTLCDHDGQCRTPVECGDQFQDVNLHIEVITEDPVYSEGYNISLRCKDCHYLTGYPEKKEYDVLCKSDGQYNASIIGCSPNPCEDLDVDTNSVEETTANDATCLTPRTFSCKKDVENFDFAFGHLELSYLCTPRSFIKQCNFKYYY